MPTSLRPRRTGVRTAALAALTLAGTTLIGATAVAAPGDNGDVKIHKVGTPFNDQRNEPKVCDFYLAAFNFDDLPDGQDIEWSIETQPLEANGATLGDTLDLEPDGTGHTLPLALPDGQYKLTWNIVGGQGAGKHKVFQVDCPTDEPTGTPTPTGTSTPPGGPGGPGGGPGGPGGGPGGPHGGVPAGGGGV
ncbi:hypothetical protein, partial [Streptomyces sp. SID12488]|uniref:hypothetical protein n=1 Tax=Streptomyces sp. SID12488 TaxID=2706040 RepID=UPI0013DCAF79